MKLCVQQKIFSWNDKFAVKDEHGTDKYFVEGEFFSWGKKLHVFDTSGNEVAFIQQKVFSFLPKFFVFVNGEQVAEIVKEFTILRPRYSIGGLEWEINGDIWSHNYEVLESGRNVVNIKKEWFTWGDCYVLDLADNTNDVVALAVVLAIDCVMAQAGSSASTNS
ncbi:MAG: hypothetical protein CVU84_07795 [Firmicutes bacterium HGW-Firmicutes-1]|jgi:uncharacterized protein YxjI|nr:MAG: hypothetical protein CVU84_07795 [Firmicutes bacterium HGW-Firmicutes-1]